MNEAFAKLLAVAVAWDVLIVQLAVLPYWNKRESLHKEWIQSGAIALARTAIETNKIIPALARMFERAHATRDDKRKKVEMASLLEEIDFIPDLKEIEGAMKELADIGAHFEEMKKLADRISTSALINCFLTLAFALGLHFDSAQTYWVPTTTSGFLWAVSGFFTVRSLFRFRGCASRFVAQLEANRGSQHGA